MKLHPRTLPVQRATAELRQTVIDWEAEHDLTVAEVAVALGEIQHRYLRLLLRGERHPDDPEKKADEA